MAGSIILYPLSITRKVSDMNSKLESVETVISDIQNAYARMADEKELGGKAWDSVKGYIKDIQQPYLISYKAWKTEHKEALEIYSCASSNLPSVQKLDRSQMENTITRSENIIQRQRDREHPNYNTIYFYEDLINELRKKIDAMDTFISAIRGIFDSSDNMQKVIANASTEINKVKLSENWDSIEYTGLMTNNSICELTVIAGMYSILQDGIKEELAGLYEIGLTDRDIGIAYMRSKARGDGNFIINFIRKDYSAAFASIEGDKALSESSSLFVVKYFLGLSMLERELIENSKSVMDTIDINSLSRPKELRQMRIKELEDFTNAILASKDAEKIKGNFSSLQKVAETNIISDVLSIINCEGEMSDRRYRGIIARCNNLLALATFFGSNTVVINDQTSYLKSFNLNEANIKNLNINENTGCYYYDISYKIYGNSGVYEKMLDERNIDFQDTIYTDIKKDGTSVSDLLRKHRLEEYYKKRDNLLNDSFDDWMMDMATLGLSDRIPFLGSVVDLAVSVQSGSADDSYSAVNDLIDETSLGENELIQKVIDSKSLDALAKTTDAVTGYFSSKEEIEQLIKEYDNEKEAEFFLSAGVFFYGENRNEEHIVSIGRYNPEIAMTSTKIKKVGFKGFLNLDEEYTQSSGISNFETKLGDKNSIRYKLWNGGIDMWNTPATELDNELNILNRDYNMDIQAGHQFENEYNYNILRQKK